MQIRFRTGWLLIIAVTLLCSATYGSGPAETQLKKVEGELLTAYVMLDFATLEKIYAPDFVNISYDGAVATKKEIVATIRNAVFRVDSIPVSDSRIRIFGSTAIVTGIRKYYRSGIKLNTVRYTEVWIKKGWQWQCVSGQLTMVQDKI